MTRTKIPLIAAAVILIGSARAAADSRSDCASRCPVCGGDAVCTQIYDNCVNNCLRGPAKPSPPLADVFGAIAIFASTLVYGTSWNYGSEKDADARAMQECQRSTSARDCKVVVTVADVCAGNATLKCQRAGGKSCVVKTQFCADGIKHDAQLPSSTAAPFGRR